MTARGPIAGDDPDDAGVVAVRRAPFSVNPTVGARGQRTQQKILDAALRVFGESGYDRSTLDRVAQVAGCSRVSIYQYFAGKDDIFRHLAGQVARELRASMEALEPVTPDRQGWSALRAWVSRYADIHERYEPVFQAFDAAAATDEALVGGAATTAARSVGAFLDRLATSLLPPEEREAVVVLLLAGVNRALGLGSILRTAAPAAYAPERVEAAVADVVHRVLFGALPGVNARPAAGPRPPALPMGDRLAGIFDQARSLQAESGQPGRKALASMLAVAGDVVASRGYKGTRVDDVVAAAGVSHGAFYRYFENIDEYVRLVAARAVDETSGPLRALPDPGGRESLRRWLLDYRAVHAAQGPLIRVWVEAVETELRDERAAVFDWGRRRLVRLLGQRSTGDPAVEAVVLLAVVEAFGSAPAAFADVDAAIRIVERGFLGDGEHQRGHE